jgi:hypothetical protein
VYPAKPGLRIGFHGCDLSVRDKLVTGKTVLRPGNNVYDWRGNGIYFWENNHQRAFDIAKELKKGRSSKANIKTSAVVAAVLDMGFCLDVLDTEYISLDKQSYETLLASCKTLGLAMPENNKVGNSADLLLRNLDCAAINDLHLEREKNNMKAVDSVRVAFVEGDPLHENAGFYDKNHIQVCVRNPNCIKGYFIPLMSSDEGPVP